MYFFIFFILTILAVDSAAMPESRKRKAAAQPDVEEVFEPSTKKGRRDAQAGSQKGEFTCPYKNCAKIYEVRSALLVHRLREHKEGTKCPEQGCKYRYLTKEQIKLHSVVHSDPWQCFVVDCRKKNRFNSKSALKRHYTTVHAMTDEKLLQEFLLTSETSRKDYKKNKSSQESKVQAEDGAAQADTLFQSPYLEPKFIESIANELLQELEKESLPLLKESKVQAEDGAAQADTLFQSPYLEPKFIESIANELLQELEKESLPLLNPPVDSPSILGAAQEPGSVSPTPFPMNPGVLSPVESARFSPLSTSFLLSTVQFPIKIKPRAKKD